MSEKRQGGPRRDRELANEREEEGVSAGPGALSRSAPVVPPEFAAAVQVTEAERLWIREHLAGFYENQLITDVIRRIKAGKEATVYLCAPHPSTGTAPLAAKLYRKHSLRSSKN